jgi:hypothetical protein
MDIALVIGVHRVTDLSTTHKILRGEITEFATPGLRMTQLEEGRGRTARFLPLRA